MRTPTRRRRIGATGLLALALVTASVGMAPSAQADSHRPLDNPRQPPHQAPPSILSLRDDGLVAPDADWIGPGYALRGLDGWVDCDPCVRNMQEQLFGDGNVTATRKTRDFRLPRPNSGLIYDARHKTHNQGVGLLRDTVINGQTFSRTALSYNDNQEGGGLMIAAHAGAGPGTDTGRGRLDYGAPTEETDLPDGRHAVHLDITNHAPFGNHAHPGGLSTQGDTVAIAMEEPQGPDRRAGVYFVRVNGTTPRYLHTAWLGGQPPGVELNLTSAASVGFTRRAMGGFVMAVSGARDGQGGIWWYVTDDAEISETTTWKYVDFWDPEQEMASGVCDLSGGEHNNDCFIGGGGGTALVTGCDGQLYVVVTAGTDGTRWKREKEYAQVLEVSQDPGSRSRFGESPRGEVQLKSIWTTKRELGRFSIREISYRWTGGANVLSDGSLTLLSTERRNRRDSNGWVDGYFRIGGRNTIRP